jgi:GntR family transcriptional regulator
MSDSPLRRLAGLLRPQAPIPLYHQVASLLRRGIEAGEWGEGEALPSEHELAEAFGVSRITTKRALDELKAAGLVRRQRGRGSFVARTPREHPLTAPLGELMAGLEVIARDTEVEVLGFERSEPPPRLAALFAHCRGKLVRAVRLRRREGKPFAHYLSYTAIADRRFDRRALAARSRIELFKELGLVIRRAEQFLSAAAAEGEVAALLELDPGAPVLTLERISYGADGQAFDWLFASYHPDRFRYHMVLDGDARR